MDALFAIRLSQLSEVTTSPERQAEHCDRWARVHDVGVAGQAIDLGVSGSMSPFERPDLGPWLTDTPPEPWDVLVAWRLDRVARDALDTLLLLQWFEARGKRLVTVTDGLDSAGPYAKAFITLAAVFAEMSRTASLEMSADARAKLKADGKWVGETVAYGYRVGEDNRLEVDPATAPTVVRIFKLSENGEQGEAVARKLGDGWSGQKVLRILRNPSYIGLGTPPAPAIIDPEVFERAQRSHKTPLRSESAELSQVVCCYVCEHPMWIQRVRGYGHPKDYFLCKTKGHTLKIRADMAAELALMEFIDVFGKEHVYDEIIHPDTTAAEASLCRVELTTLAGQMADGDRVKLLARMAGLSETLTELEARPAVDRIERIDTGRTWKEEVERLSLAELGDELRQRGHRIGIRLTSRKPLVVEMRTLP